MSIESIVHVQGSASSFVMDTAKLDQEFCTNELLGTSMAQNLQYCLHKLDDNPDN